VREKVETLRGWRCTQFTSFTSTNTDDLSPQVREKMETLRGWMLRT
jgi:hypothetical protein